MPKILAYWIVLLAAAIVLGACSSPEVDPELEVQLRTATVQNAEELIAKETERLGITALTFTVLEDGKAPPTSYFGRAKGGGLMQVAGLSKTVSAAVILKLAELQSVAIDDDIGPQITSLDISSLEGGDRPITLRQLLSHTAGSSQSGYPGYPRGSDLPSTAEVIASPPRAFESTLAFDGEPGEFLYSGGGYIIAQLWA